MIDIDTNHMHLYSHDHLTEYEIVLGYGDDNEQKAHMCSVDLRHGTQNNESRGYIIIFLLMISVYHDPFHLAGKIFKENKNPIISRIGDIVCSPDKLSYACFGQSLHKFSIHSKESNKNTLCCGEKVQMTNEVYECVGYKTSGSWLKGHSDEQCILVSDSCGCISKYEAH